MHADTGLVFQDLAAAFALEAVFCLHMSQLPAGSTHTSAKRWHVPT